MRAFALLTQTVMYVCVLHVCIHTAHANHANIDLYVNGGTIVASGDYLEADLPQDYEWFVVEAVAGLEKSELGEVMWMLVNPQAVDEDQFTGLNEWGSSASVVFPRVAVCRAYVAQCSVVFELTTSYSVQATAILRAPSGPIPGGSGSVVKGKEDADDKLVTLVWVRATSSSGVIDTNAHYGVYATKFESTDTVLAMNTVNKLQGLVSDNEVSFYDVSEPVCNFSAVNSEVCRAEVTGPKVGVPFVFAVAVTKAGAPILTINATSLYGLGVSYVCPDPPDDSLSFCNPNYVEGDSTPDTPPLFYVILFLLMACTVLVTQQTTSYIVKRWGHDTTQDDFALDFELIMVLPHGPRDAVMSLPPILEADIPVSSSSYSSIGSYYSDSEGSYTSSSSLELKPKNSHKRGKASSVAVTELVKEGSGSVTAGAGVSGVANTGTRTHSTREGEGERGGTPASELEKSDAQDVGLVVGEGESVTTTATPNTATTTLTATAAKTTARVGKSTPPVRTNPVATAVSVAGSRVRGSASGDEKADTRVGGVESGERGTTPALNAHGASTHDDGVGSTVCVDKDETAAATSTTATSEPTHAEPVTSSTADNAGNTNDTNLTTVSPTDTGIGVSDVVVVASQNNQGSHGSVPDLPLHTSGSRTFEVSSTSSADEL